MTNNFVRIALKKILDSYLRDIIMNLDYRLNADQQYEFFTKILGEPPTKNISFDDISEYDIENMADSIFDFLGIDFQNFRIIER